MNRSPLEKIFGNNAQTTVLENLLKNQGESIHPSGIARETELSHSSVARALEPLIEINIVIEKRLGKQIRVLTLNEENEIVNIIVKFYCDLVALYDKK